MPFGLSRSSSSSSSSSSKKAAKKAAAASGKKPKEAEHTSGARPSTEGTHQKGQTRRQNDQAGRKAHKSGAVKPNPNTANGRAAAKKAAEKKKGNGRG